MRGMELEALLCVECLLAVEKVGRDWMKTRVEVNDVKEVEGVEEKDGTRQLTEEEGGFGEDNMKEYSTKLARE